MESPSSGIWSWARLTSKHMMSQSHHPETQDPDQSSATQQPLSGSFFCFLFLLLHVSFLGWSVWCQSPSESWMSEHVRRQIIKKHFPPLLCSFWLGKQQLMKLADVKVIVLREGVVFTHPFHRSGKQRTRERTRHTQNKQVGKSPTLFPVASSWH